MKTLSAESEGFEPPVPCGTTVFKTAAIDHSANSLNYMNTSFRCFVGAKIIVVLVCTKSFG